MDQLIGTLNPATLVVFAALAVLSFLSITVSVFKMMQFARLGVGKRARAEEILDTWLSGRGEEAMKLASERKSVLARILQAVFTGVQAKPGETGYAEELGRQSAIIELASMSDRMRVLEIVVQAAPMLGLLGTVIGMIDAFSVLSLSEGGVDPAALAGGIWTALTTTAVGLSIALVAYFFASWFESRIDRERNLIEAAISAAIYGRVDPTAGT
ncbi:MotA/TolQ/ExbB proton channel [Sulfitobacter noctilucae]|uniref:MotA/TolQ/ExbB proton channel family protein n=1 Tax=Sulfitobacter noctilucae TaxID=1342302 RepID=UPI0004697F4C|nr:MotA/TolQ/ExbB proton channel family protein [Sulfitobacter noctilucae]KIN75136.1 MotA/TolQ/ExbB proton channel [Sulfitobacter noctilucae]